MSEYYSKYDFEIEVLEIAKRWLQSSADYYPVFNENHQVQLVYYLNTYEVYSDEPDIFHRGKFIQ